MAVGLVLTRALLLAGCLIALGVPAWWASGRLQRDTVPPFLRLLCAAGLALVGYLSAVNLPGRLFGHSTLIASVYLALNAVAATFLWQKRRSEVGVTARLGSWRSWLPSVLLAFTLGLPQWLLAVSTPYWDEVASSAIHITAANQFAEGVFPPRHNALPDIAIKYHYGFTMLSGTLVWLTGLPANDTIDMASTALWLFAFLFVYHWLQSLRLGKGAALWGSTAGLLGGGLGWLYLRRIEVYSGFDKLPPASALKHVHDPDKGWVVNLLRSTDAPAAHLRNADGSVSNLPWDIAAQFQQHAVALGIVLMPFALYVFVAWLRSPGWHAALYLLNIATFGVLFLGHAVFGGVAAVSAGLVLLLRFALRPSVEGLLRGLAFTAGVLAVALLHGGLLATGAEYGATGDVFRLRDGFGYHAGGLAGFIHWNLAGFGLPVLLAMVACGVAAWCFLRARQLPLDRHDAASRDAVGTTLQVLVVATAFSYLVPQLAYYSSQSSQVETTTEIAKFFFPAHLSLALLSAFGIAFLARWRRFVLGPGLIAMVICPLAFTLHHSRAPAEGGKARHWIGFYRSPYFPGSVEEQLGTTLRRLKHGPNDVYFDASADERRHHYLSHLLIFGGSVFTLTPSRYERNGIGYRLAESVVARRLVQNSRMQRLRPGAPEECNCRWVQSQPSLDFALAPLLVRSRFAKLVTEGYFVERARIGRRVLYAVERPTLDLDHDLHRYWRPRVVLQANSDWTGDGKDDLIFYDPVAGRVFIAPKNAGRQGTHTVVATEVVPTPSSMRDETTQLFVARFPGDPGASLLVGKLEDTEYRHGRHIGEVIERSLWGWSHRSANQGTWQDERATWSWDGDLPFVADLDQDGIDAHLAYHSGTGEWSLASGQRLAGPHLDARQLPIPFAGRFLEGSSGDLGLWSLAGGRVLLQSVGTGRRVELPRGRTGDVLVPADYDGDGYDEIGLWDRDRRIWSWRKAPDGPTTEVELGTSTSVPVPADYDHDGRVDLAYWEPGEAVIYVSFSQGRTVDQVLSIPPGTIPAFVHMY